MTKDDVLKAIEEAFRAAPHPGDEHFAGQVSQCPSEYSYVADYFKGKHWKDITLDGLQKDYPGPHDACLSFMSPEAFRFYLPSYMVIAITEEGSGDTATEAAVNALRPPKLDPHLYELANTVGDPAANPFTPVAVERRKVWWERRVSGFTTAQQQAIVVFLDYLIARWKGDPKFGPHDALAYWKQRAGAS